MTKWKQRELEFRAYVPAGSSLSEKEDKYYTCINNLQDHKEKKRYDIANHKNEEYE